MLCCLGTCDQQSCSTTAHSNIVEIKREGQTNKPQIKADSILVYYWEIYVGNEYYFSYSNERIDIRGTYFNFKKEIHDVSVIHEFLRYINLFYIDKTEIIILSKKEEPAPISDYPEISVKCYLEGKKIIDNKTILYSDLEFNPKFLAFYNFLDSLVK